MQNMEIWDLYNEQRQLTGRDHIRGEEIPQGCFHLVVHVWIRNSRGEYLISQRSADRPTHPLKWECTGGSALKGEDSLAAALRETQEELGLILSPSNGKIVFSEVGRIKNGVRFSDILDVWLFEYDGSVDLSKATTKEVAQFAWLDRAEIKALFDEKEFVDTLSYFFDTATLNSD
ncbi:MAG: NUDIX domain-containing protein [Oscillospiraceae bacterium]|nr:NUDIX domain-containing protein [Oscillospiraceae bacterium]